MSFASPEFWVALLQIIGINIVLSGDNAVVIALAARSLPPAQQKRAIAWGSGAAVVMRILLTIVAVELLRLPYLKLIGAALLLWIAVQLLLPEDEGDGHGAAGGTLAAAIKTILLADLVMSLDNVIGVAAAAKGSVVLLVAGLAISIPLVIFASTLLLGLMGRFPVIVTIGAGLLGWVAGEMAVSDPAIAAWVDTQMPLLHRIAPAVGAIGVVLVGKWLAARRTAAPAEPRGVAPVAPPTDAQLAAARRTLLAIDGSDDSQRAAHRLIAMRRHGGDGAAAGGPIELHLLNVQPPVPGDVSTFVADASIERYHDERSDAALAASRALLDAAGIPYQVHAAVGDPATEIASLAERLRCDLIVMGTRGLGATAAALLGSVARRTVERSAVPVLLAP